MGKTIITRKGNLVHYMTEEEVAEEIEEQKILKHLKPGESTPSGRYTMGDGYVIDNSNESWDDVDSEAESEYLIRYAVCYIPSKNVREYLLKNIPSWDWRQCFSVAFKYALTKKEKIRYFSYLLDFDFVTDCKSRNVIRKAIKAMKRCPSKMLENVFVRIKLQDPEYQSFVKHKQMTYEQLRNSELINPYFWDSYLNLPEIFKKGDVVRDISDNSLYVITANHDSKSKGQDSSDDYIVGNFQVHLNPCMLEKISENNIPRKFRDSIGRMKMTLV